MLQDKIIETFVTVDDFCKIFEDQIKKYNLRVLQLQM